MRVQCLRVSALLAALLLPLATVRAGELGQVYFQVPGLAELDSRAQVAESGKLVQTVNEGAVVRLANGEVLRLDPNTTVKLETGADEADVRVRVLSGRVRKWSPVNGVLEAGAGSWFVLGPSLADQSAVEELLLAAPEARAALRPARSRR